MAIFFSYFFFFIFILCCCRFFKSQERLCAFKIVCMGVAVYSFVAVMSWMSYAISGNAFILYPDQYHFYDVADGLAQSKSWSQIFVDCFIDRIHYENEAILFWMGSIGYFANIYADGNSVLLQLIHVALVASLIPLTVYKLLLYYFPVRVAWENAILYLFMSYILHFCAFLLRDVHIALFCGILLVLVQGRFSVLKLILQLCVVWVLSEMRTESGMIAMLLVLLYVFLPRQNANIGVRWKLWGIRISVVLACVFFSASLLGRLDSVVDSMVNYTAYTADAVGTGSEALQKLYSLPWGLNYLGVVTLSQISPFPCWGIFRNVENLYQGITAIGLCTAPVFWFIVYFVLVKCWLSKWFQIRFPLLLKWLLLFFVVFLFLNVFNMTIRRLICFYPIVFLAYVFCKEQVNASQWRKMILQGVGMYSCLCVLYLVIML